MKKKNSDHAQADFSGLRQQAEKLLSENESSGIPPNSLEDAQRLITELQIHQIELELQNDELRKTQEELAEEREKYADLYNFAPAAYFTFDERDVIIDLNLLAAQMLGNERKFLVNHPLTPYITPDSLQDFVNHRNQALVSETDQICELTIRPRRGVIIHMQARTVALKKTNPHGPQLWRTVMTDITERKRMEKDLQSSEERFRSLVLSLSDLIFTLDTKQRHTGVYGDWVQRAGLTPGIFLGRTAQEILGAENAVVHENANIRALTGQTASYEWSAGTTHYQTAVSPMRNSTGEIVGIVGVGRDITEFKRVEKELQAKTDILNTIFDSAPFVLMLVDEEGRVQNINQAGSAFAGREKSDLIGLLGGEVFNCLNSFKGGGCGHNTECGNCPVRTRVTHTFQTGNSIYNAEGRLTVMRDGNPFDVYMLISSTMVKTATGNMVLVAIADITERKRIEDNLKQTNDILQVHVQEIELLHEQLREQAIRDPLTGLFNRRYLQETLEREVSRAQREEKPIGFIIMDLDHFKQVNDLHGHRAGDMALQKLGGLIVRNLRMGDISCRYGGEEFTVMMPGASLEKTLERANFLLNQIGEMDVISDGIRIRITASMGVSVYPEHGSSGEEALIHADHALYLAKRQGRNQVVVYQNQE